MSDFEKYLQHIADDIQDSNVKEAMQYSLMAGGKRIRPRLLFAALEAYGMDAERGKRCAAAIEMIHTYSLVHDDLPAMDNDTLRRGLPTCHVKFGEAVAILAGDALLTQAFVLGSTASDEASVNVHIVQALGDYSGANGMILGQIKDLEGEEQPALHSDELKAIHIYKTGKLLTLPFLCAAYLAHREEDIDVWNEIGRRIGLSFQIQDDILDVTSTVEELGKNINSDIENDKATYVKLMGIEKAQKEADRYYHEAYELLHTLPICEEPIRLVFDELTRRSN